MNKKNKDNTIIAKADGRISEKGNLERIILEPPSFNNVNNVSIEFAEFDKVTNGNKPSPNKSEKNASDDEEAPFSSRPLILKRK